MSRPDTIANLKAVPLFQNCSARQLRRIANLGRESTFEAGRNLCEEGKFSKEFFVILEGHAEVRRGGRKRGTLGSGDYQPPAFAHSAIEIVASPARITP